MSLLAHTLSRCGQNVTVESRDMTIVNGKASEVFSDPIAISAAVKTVTGVSAFDNTNTDTVVTHRLCVVYNADITAEKWVRLNTKRIRIISVENCCEKNETMILLCTERGTDGSIVNTG